MKNNYKKNIGSISSGTMRTEDLIPCFVSELNSMKPLKRNHWKLISEIDKASRKCNCAVLCRGKQAREDNADKHEQQYFDSETAYFDLNEGLFDALNEYCLPYFYFGAHVGDGADYGYWLSDDFKNEFDGLKVNDLAEVPKGYTGEVLLVNDHGNMSLYAYNRGRDREIWTIV